jgi:hypothetical protein
MGVDAPVSGARPRTSRPDRVSLAAEPELPTAELASAVPAPELVVADLDLPAPDTPGWPTLDRGRPTHVRGRPPHVRGTAHTRPGAAEFPYGSLRGQSAAPSAASALLAAEYGCEHLGQVGALSKREATALVCDCRLCAATAKGGSSRVAADALQTGPTWQRGCFSLSVSASHEEAVAKYVRNQRSASVLSPIPALVLRRTRQISPRSAREVPSVPRRACATSRSRSPLPARALRRR